MELNVLTAEQKGVRLYVGVVPVKELLKRAKVDYWTPSTPDGYQRPLVARRIAEGAWYLIEGEGIFPTSILISIREGAEFYEQQRFNGVVFGLLKVRDDVPWWIIDGQHRKEMLQEAINRGERSLEEYQVPVTFFISPDKFAEMRAFYLVNSRAKSVPTDIADRLLQQALKAAGKIWLLTKESPSPKKAEKAIYQARAATIVDYLREKCPIWKDKVEVPGEPKPSPYATRQHTLVVSLLEGPFKDPSLTRLDDQSLGDLLDRYWCALANVFPDAFKQPEVHSIQRTQGVYSLHMIFPDVFERCREARDYSQKKMAEILWATGLDSNFWHTHPAIGDPRTLGTGMKSIRLLAAYLTELLPKISLAGL